MPAKTNEPSSRWDYLLKVREPGYDSVTKKWYWRLANKHANELAILKFRPGTSLLPWQVYWGMSRSLGAYRTEYETRQEAVNDLEHGIEHPFPD